MRTLDPSTGTAAEVAPAHATKLAGKYFVYRGIRSADKESAGGFSVVARFSRFITSLMGGIVAGSTFGWLAGIAGGLAGLLAFTLSERAKH